MTKETILASTKKIIKKITEDKILYDILAIFLLLLPILLTADKYVRYVGTALTGIPFVLGIVCVILYQKRKRIKYALIAVLLIINAFIAENLSEQFEYVKELIILFITFDIVFDKDFLKTIKKYFEKYHEFITISICSILIANFLLLITGKVVSQYADIWNIQVFQGMYFDPNQAGYRFCAFIAFLMFLIKAKKNNWYINLGILGVTELLLLQTGARTPTLLGIAMGMICLYFMRYKLLEIVKKNKKICIPILVLILIGIVIYIPQSSFIQKSLVSAQNTFDNGRTILRDAGWQLFINSKPINKLFGNDINLIYYLNEEVMKAPIWSHNDLMQILLQFGDLMLVVYLGTIIQAMIYHLQGQKRFDKFIIILLYAVFLFVAFFNGLFYHPRFVISIPIIFMVYKCYCLEEK